jgi:MFS family permease
MTDHSSSSDKNIKKNLVINDQQLNISKSAWLTLAILGSTLLITMFGETMLLPAIPDIIKDYNISYNTSSWILTAYLISGAVMTPIAGKLSDIYGRKKMVIIIIPVYIIGIILGGLSFNFSTLIFSRILQGIGISMFPIAFGIIRDQLPHNKLAIGVGIFSSMFAAGSVVGLGLGAIIVQNFGWHATFLSIIPIAIILWIVIIRFIIEDRKDRFFQQIKDVENTDTGNNNNKKGVNEEFDKIPSLKISLLDYKGSITLAVTIISFLLAITYLGMQNSSSISSTLTPSSLGIISVASLILFIFFEKRAAFPLIDLKLMVHKIILPANIVLMIFGMTMFMVYQSIPVLVRTPEPIGFSGDAITAANIQLPFMIIFLIFAPSSGFIISKFGTTKPIILGSLISTIGFFSILLFHSTMFVLSANLALVAIGLSLLQVGGFNLAIESAPRQYSGVSLGMTVVLHFVASSVGPAIAGIYMQIFQTDIHGINGLFPSNLSYNLIFLTAALLSSGSIGLSVMIKKRMTIKS